LYNLIKYFPLAYLGEIFMSNLAPDEKATLVMVYTHDLLVRGEVVTKESARVSIWPRTQGVPNFIHLLKPNVLLFGGSPPKPLSYSEMFLPTASAIGFHLAPPATEALDYDPQEKNRTMEPVNIMLGTFLIKGKIRISAATSLGVSLEVVYAGWLSIYDVEITNPYLPQMQPMLAPMMLITPSKAAFAR
jgi:hypothetical protein